MMEESCCEIRYLLCLLGKEWGGDFLPYVAKVKELGFDVLKLPAVIFIINRIPIFMPFGDSQRE